MVGEEKIKLTQYSSGAGCGCKIAPAVLEKILKNQKSSPLFDRLIVGNHSNDDAAVWDLGDDNYLISTADFFTPIVDDPFEYGRIAAANAVSDVYAMGGKPVFALSLLGWPVDKLSPDIAAEVIRGATAICNSIGIPLAGGHSISTTEPVFGLSVNGMVKKPHLKKNNTAQEEDLLLLTKPLGTGIISTAQKRGIVTEEDYKNALEVMTEVNIAGAELAKINGITAMTDVTGFGLIGHLIEMTRSSGLTAEISYDAMPMLPGLNNYIEKKAFPDNTYRNWNCYEKQVRGITGPSFIVLNDPQTNGGLLIAVKQSAFEEVAELLKSFSIPFRIPIGKLTAKQDVTVVVHEGD
jgi:selenide, water dikinase